MLLERPTGKVISSFNNLWQPKEKMTLYLFKTTIDCSFAWERCNVVPVGYATFSVHTSERAKVPIPLTLLHYCAIAFNRLKSPQPKKIFFQQFPNDP
jgi:hypothetical protein